METSLVALLVTDPLRANSTTRQIPQLMIHQTLLRRLGELNARQHVLDLLQLFTFPAYENSP